MCTNIGVHEPAVEALGLDRRIERDCMLAHARCAIVALAADGDDQRIVGEAARWRHLVPFFVEIGGEMNLARAAVEPNQLTNAVAEMMPMRLCQKIDLMHT